MSTRAASLRRKGFVIGAERLAPRGAQMLRPRLHGDHRRAWHVRHADRLCRRKRRRRWRSRRIAVMDSDGYNHRYVTAGDAMVLTPRLAPKGAQLAYVSFAGGKPSVRIVDLEFGQERPLVPGDAMSFAPRFSPDGSRIAFSMMLGANSDIYVVELERRRAAAADDLAGHRHRPELLARRQQDRVRKRPRRIAAALRDECRRHGPAPDQLRRRLVCARRNGARTANGSPLPGAGRTGAESASSARRHRRADC